MWPENRRKYKLNVSSAHYFFIFRNTSLFLSSLSAMSIILYYSGWLAGLGQRGYSAKMKIESHQSQLNENNH
jgi:hypothetical protein